MKAAAALAVILAVSAAAAAQRAPQSSPAAASAAGAGSVAAPSLAQLSEVLAAVNEFSQRTALDLARLRIEKWKTGAEHKRQAQQDADSLSNNLSAALPEILAAVRATPAALAPGFKLYRDLNALHEVLSGVTESAGAFGPGEDYNALAADLQSLDAARRALGDFLQQLAAYKDAEVVRMGAQAGVTTGATAPRKVIVDDNPPPLRHARKRTSVKPAAAKPASAAHAASKPSAGNPQPQ